MSPEDIQDSTSAESQLPNEPSTSDNTDNKRIKLDIPRVTASHYVCIICGVNFNTSQSKSIKTKTLDIHERSHIFIRTGILVHVKACCCLKHFENNLLKSELIDELKPEADTTLLSASEVEELLLVLRDAAKKKGCLDFDDPNSLTDEDYQRLTGITKSQFDIVLTYMSSLKTTKIRNIRTALAVLLVKLRTALPSSILSTLFAIRKRNINRIMASVRQDLCKSFVPSFLGFNHITRHEIIEKHTTVFAKTLFGGNRDVAITITDGTYIYIEKSSNYSFQRRSYSMHKSQSLLKPMLVVASDGYIITVIGPYLADGKNNDAQITKHAFGNNVENIKNWYEDDDIMVVDRGYRDCIDFLSDLGIKAEMPHFLPKGQHQHTTLQGNESRYVTKVRWVVESANGRIKQWKALSNRVQNLLIPSIRDFVRIVCALCNVFRPPLASSSSLDEVVAERMLSLCNSQNLLQQKVKAEKLDKKKVVWKNIDESELEDFPKLNLSELRDLTFGIYQIKQAQSYMTEHLNDDGDYRILVHKEYHGLIKVQIQSRHTLSKVHNLWIEYRNGITPIFHWYCTCKAGARVVGCCAHIASVIWYLSYYRHQPPTPKVSQQFFSHVDDAVQVDCWTDSELESDSENESNS